MQAVNLILIAVIINNTIAILKKKNVGRRDNVITILLASDCMIIYDI